MKINNILIKPIVTEKSMAGTGSNVYSFKVALASSKNAIASELKRMYNVDAVAVNTMVMPGKQKRILKTRQYTKSNNWKKAVVKLKEGQHIDLFPKEK